MLPAAGSGAGLAQRRVWKRRPAAPPSPAGVAFRLGSGAPRPAHFLIARCASEELAEEGLGGLRTPGWWGAEGGAALQGGSGRARHQRAQLHGSVQLCGDAALRLQQEWARSPCSALAPKAAPCPLQAANLRSWHCHRRDQAHPGSSRHSFAHRPRSNGSHRGQEGQDRQGSGQEGAPINAGALQAAAGPLNISRRPEAAPCAGPLRQCAMVDRALHIAAARPVQGGVSLRRCRRRRQPAAAAHGPGPLLSCSSGVPGRV